MLFQLPSKPSGTIISKDHLDKIKIVLFMSFQFTDMQRPYHATEREALAVIKCLAECRWLVKGPSFPSMLYTDHHIRRQSARCE